MPESTNKTGDLPADDLGRALALTQVDGPTAQHIGMVGNTYTIFTIIKGESEVTFRDRSRR